mmetsp:Transcript_23533/g.36180  ORF Transcript_23533/g.36180 Transcript_23533/m.36180 type:complete len:142 (+) Transcript_23533:491-916(+)|eukprot:CAMPEP_0118724772 /NCGR_PEP_ID=MMETSP0800-20121206/32778_1 /TAXON_ID=210618 ORGANISM="Striatella unipunctata, Strain CCMP2910" /NCGR_SAMPLE_ID=MMETSP0800 /ASSEMBLY_ACC=CAM_ASM_000638 /LENGTH=141 /DNA_ID=CAMNT_0006633413 /DNA_START=500 /DNA_END=925 /DNA_ORIENTATION=+
MVDFFWAGLIFNVVVVVVVVLIHERFQRNRAEQANMATLQQQQQQKQEHSKQGSDQIRLAIWNQTQTLEEDVIIGDEETGEDDYSSKCPICLNGMQIGQEITRSTDPQCHHSYHKECILEWMLRPKSELHCPCCRRDFVNI